METLLTTPVNWTNLSYDLATGDKLVRSAHWAQLLARELIMLVLLVRFKSGMLHTVDSKP